MSRKIHLKARDEKILCSTKFKGSPLLSSNPSLVNCGHYRNIYGKYWSDKKFRSKLEKQRNWVSE